MLAAIGAELGLVVLVEEPQSVNAFDLELGECRCDVGGARDVRKRRGRRGREERVVRRRGDDEACAVWAGVGEERGHRGSRGRCRGRSAYRKGSRVEKVESDGLAVAVTERDDPRAIRAEAMEQPGSVVARRL